MKIYKNYNLKNNNTFNLSAIANEFLEYENDDDFITYVNEHKQEFNENFLVIGEGSNILFTKNFAGKIIHSKTNYINIIVENENYIDVEVASGILLRDFIDRTIEQNYFGMENLSDIPGTVAASAVQNVGAYGSEIKNFILEVKFFNLNTFTIQTLSNNDCEFEYRNSIFKNKLKNKTIILSVTYRLNKKFIPNLSYIDVANAFKNIDINMITAKSVNEVIKKIRNEKLPDTKVYGNAGSFYKNPIIENTKLFHLIKKYPDIKYFEHSKTQVKISAAWLIDKCGFKGFELDGAAVYNKHALILINLKNATGNSILKLSEQIQKNILEKFQIAIEPEVVII